MWKRIKKYAKKLVRFIKDKVEIRIGESDDLFNKNNFPR